MKRIEHMEMKLEEFHAKRVERLANLRTRRAILWDTLLVPQAERRARMEVRPLVGFARY